MSLGSNIKKRRYELHLSQKELASLMGYKSRTTIAKIEAGDNDVSHAKICKFAKVLDTTYEALTQGTESTVFETLSSQEPEMCFNTDHRKNIAIILAGGKSSRSHQNVPNQFVDILGKPVIMYCLEAFQNHPSIDDIYIVCLKGWEDIVQSYAKQYGSTKLQGLIPGGDTGIQSIYNAIKFIEKRYDGDDIIFLQSATCPLITTDMISTVIQACSVSDSVTICKSLSEKVPFLVKNNSVSYVDRNNLVELMSPEAHTLNKILTVFNRAERQQHKMDETCFALLMYNLGFSFNLIEGDANNIKIVTQKDIAIATALIKNK